MSRLLAFYRSTLGKKIAMAGSGVALFGFVVVHMLGNMKLYQGEEKLQEYVVWLRELGTPAVPYMGVVWATRIGLLALVAIHIHAAISLTWRNRQARPVQYKEKHTVSATYAARTMRWSGVILVTFIVYHLLHFTVGSAHHDFSHESVYHNVVSAFSIWWVAAWYIVANLLLGVHLYHGLWSMFQSLGVTEARRQTWTKAFAVCFALVITLGNVSFPIAVLSGFVS